MPRPSRNLDKALLAAGRALLPARGCGGLSVREVAEEAGVNLGMFHYHFKTRDAFLRELLQSVYEDMFSQLQVQRDDAWSPADNLRAALRFLGRFLRANRPILSRVLADALCGDPIAIDFLKRNAPRHLGHLQALIELGQKDGSLAPMPVRLAITRTDGRVERQVLSVDPWLAGSRTQVVYIENAATVASVEIDPESAFPDTDRSNNRWARGR